MNRFLDYDHVLGQKDTFLYDEMTGEARIRSETDVTPIIEANKREMNSGHDGYTPSRDMKHLAHIPNAIIELWLTKYGVNVFDRNHTNAVRKLLDSSEWAYLRTSPGTIGCRTRHL